MLASQVAISSAEEKIIYECREWGNFRVSHGNIPCDSGLRIEDTITDKLSFIVVIWVAYMVHGPSNSGQTVLNCSLVDRFPDRTARDVR